MSGDSGSEENNKNWQRSIYVYQQAFSLFTELEATDKVPFVQLVDLS